MPRPMRTFLFAPGNRPRMLQKVGHCGADAVILDLEDAVPISEKEATRVAVRDAVGAIDTCPVYVRINPLQAAAGFSQPIGEADLAAIVRPGLAGIILPKAESPDDLRRADTLLQGLESRHGLAPGSVDVIPIIETALAIQRAYDIAASGTRTRRLAFGAGDFTRDIGVAWSRREIESQYARSALVIASRAAAIEPPFDTVWVDLRDERGLIRSARTARQLGFQGKMAIHPEPGGADQYRLFPLGGRNSPCNTRGRCLRAGRSRGPGLHPARRPVHRLPHRRIRPADPGNGRRDQGVSGRPGQYIGTTGAAG